VDEPTDRALKVQGLRRVEYDAMSTDARAMVSSRSRRLVELSNISVAVDLLGMIAESDAQGRAYAQEVIEGKHPGFEEKLRGIIRDYLDSGVETNIRDYYKIKYGKIDIAAIKEADAAGDDVRQMLNQARQNPSEIPKTFLQVNDEPFSAPVKAPTMHTQTLTSPQPANKQERRLNIAAILSRWEKRDIDNIIKTEADIIGEVMIVTDENRDKNLTDAAVCLAIEAMIKSAVNGVLFPREALTPANRDELVRMATGFI
jgi:hypothetical protein